MHSDWQIMSSLCCDQTGIIFFQLVPENRSCDVIIQIIPATGCSLPVGNYKAGLSPSHRTVHVPSFGNPGAWLPGAPSQPAAIIATA